MPFGIMDVAGLLRLNIRRRLPGQVYTDCPICGDRRGKLNINLSKNVWHCNYCDEGGGMLALYAKVYGISNSDAYREICDALATEGFAPEYSVAHKDLPPETPQSERASAQTIHQTLSLLLSMLTLTPAHRKHLNIKRGLSDEQIERFCLKSTPPPFLCRSITARLIKAGCTVQGVPGFYVDDTGNWTVKFYQRTSGIIIPIQGLDGLIQGIQVRLDHPIKNKDDPPEKSGTKYLTLSTAGKRMGTSSGSPVHFVGDPCSRVVYVTEGPLKADIAHVYMHRTFVAISGANNVPQLEGIFSFLSKNGTELIIEAADMDKYQNKMVNKGTSKIYLLASKYGMECRRLTWNPNYKGIDDWQLAVHRKKQRDEVKQMNFKQMYLHGQCGIDYIDKCIETWHTAPEDGVSLHDFLGLTEQEYSIFVQQGEKGAVFERLLESQRRRQRFRIYQLDLTDGETCPYAFSGVDALHKAGHQQPPAAAYTLAYDGEIFCPNAQCDRDILERIFDRYNDDLPADYHGRSVSPSDVLELYDGESRRYFYCDIAGFPQVKFSPALVQGLQELEAQPTFNVERLRTEISALCTDVVVESVKIGDQTAKELHTAQINLLCVPEGEQKKTIRFSGETYEDAYNALVNKINERLNVYVKGILQKQLKGRGKATYKICRSCGSSRLYHFEFRTDYALPRLYYPVNEGTPEIDQDDVPYQVSGTYCMECKSFCETETRLGALNGADRMDNA